jgi:opacity protein-like surface antigen
VLLAASALSARAADLSDISWLRGAVGDSTSPMRWDGLQFGAQIGVGSMGTDFGSSTGPMIAYILRNTTVENEMSPSSWTTLPGNVTNGKTFGAFIGYNLQWDALVVGFDLAYDRTSGFEASASDSMGRQGKTSDGFYNNVTVIAQSSVQLIDYATFRARAGYAFGQFLPYAVMGAAVGRFNYTNSARVIASGTDVSNGGGSPYSLDQSQTDSKNNAFTPGFVTGLGVDVAVLPNVFLRAEWEYTLFAPVAGIRVQLNTGRVGVGVRF